MSWKIEVVADSSGQWCGNALRFATAKKAEDHARDLESRWTAVKEWRVTESTEPVTELEEGTYVLTQDVENPKPDRRKKRDLDAQVMWPKGMRLTFLKGLEHLKEISFHSNIQKHSEQFTALSPFLVIVEMTGKEWLKVEGISPDAVLDVLIDTGVVSKEAVKKVWDDLG